jgi:hypothetical protein
MIAVRKVLLKPAWMLDHRCRANEKQEETDNVGLEHQAMFVAHGINAPKPSQKTPMRIHKRVPAVEMSRGHVFVRRS